MAVITASGSHDPIARGVIRSTWTFPAASTTGSIGTVLCAPTYPDKTVNIRGTWATGVTIQIQGSNTATYSTGTSTWAILSTACGADLSLSTGRSRTILQNPKWIRPRLSARTGTLGAVTVEIISQSTKR